MAEIVGKYQYVKNENMDAYFAAVGVPYIPRKMIALTSPSLEVSKEGNEWTIVSASMMRSTIYKFILGNEYEEQMPNGQTLKNISNLESDTKLVTNSVVADTGVKTSRVYDFDENGCVITFTFGDVVAKRFYDRIK